MHSVPCCHLIDYFSCSKWVSIHVCPSLLPETLILSSWLKKFVPIYSSCDFLLDEKMSLVSSLWLILPVLVHHMHRIIQLSSFQSLSCVWLCDLMHCSTPGFYVLHHLPELAQTHVPWVSDAIWPCHSLLSPSRLTSTFPSIRVFSKDLAVLIRWPKYWSFSFSISFSNENSGSISFRIDWFDLLAVQGTLKSLLQHHSSKASILQCSAFFMVQLSHPYMTNRKTIAVAYGLVYVRFIYWTLLFQHLKKEGT